MRRTIEKIRETKAITLIALVVTIVVLLILAAVSINLILDENGIIKKSKDARKSWLEAQEKEQQAIDDFVKENLPSWDGKTTELPETKANETTGKLDWYIYNEGQMKFLANYVNETLTQQDLNLIADNGMTKEDLKITEDTTIYLMNDLNLGAVIDQQGNLISGEQWVPIGPSKTQILEGTFEGNNHYICGVYINREEKYNGIFGNCSTIKNLTIKNSYIEGGACTGGTAGVARKGIVDNCHNINTKVVLKEEALYTVGGVIGQSTGEKVANCTNTGTVVSYGSRNFCQMGGICGLLMNTDIINCSNYGKIIQEVDEDLETISDLNAYVGGICGVFMTNMEGKGIIKECHNGAEIKGIIAVGGIVGGSYIGTTIQNCSNTGKIEACSVVGGIVGQLGNTENGLSHSILKECYNSGNITRKNMQDYSQIGGIIGLIRDKGREDVISKCYSKGNILNAKEGCGAVIGEEENIEGKAKISDLYYYQEVGVGAINNTDDETRRLQPVTEDIKTYDEFVEWIKNINN